jgi:hypothetical protein
MTSARLIKLFPNLINDQAVFEGLGVQGSASLPNDFDDMYEEILLVDEENLVTALAAQGKEDDVVGSAAPSDAGQKTTSRRSNQGRWIGMNEANGA